MKWSLSAQALTALPFVSIAGWTGFAAYQRTNANSPPRGLTFNTGSMDDIMSDTLKTGDLVLFRRNCAYMQPLDAASCFLTGKVESWKSQYNHCGFIFVNHIGDKFIVEETYSGVKCRPYSARILTSMSTDIVVVPLRRTKEMELAAKQFIEENVNRPSRFSLSNVLEQLTSPGASADKSTPIFPAAGLIAEVYQRMGLLPESSSSGYLSPNKCTIKDWSQFARVKLLQDAHFDRRLQIRLL
ncbi:Aste57867_325 [Aphanomyces stellatus]|uniref:Aste57867_325 protein n=1 Tax=Aphanomyces stellatus TaxID=120398 RepID=A0A485K7A3_9STRA|nr:hypothetical protein As57867_000325 [Aphanomyces stellatus]VFT77551.1 Aste57867_325 [Aphanomyces stellatus]